jgi:NAD(P)-dependent dehydrogenase (short-subunit alcohol dehydrogenase family)
MESTVLITGTNRGLGLALTRQFFKQNFRVYSLSRSISDELQQLRDQYPEQLTCYLADVNQESQLTEIAREFSDQNVSLEILVNNAAIHLDHPAPDILDLDGDAVLKTLQVNSLGPLLMVKHFLPFIRRLIVNVSSEAGSIHDSQRDRQFGYCMSKAALNMASKILQNRLADENKKVLAIHPGWFSSDMGGEEAPLTPNQAAEQVVKTILQDWKLTDPIYIDGRNGERMSW